MYPSQGGASPAGGFTHPPVSEGQNIKQDKFSTDSGVIDSGFHSGQNFSSDNLFSSSSSVPGQQETLPVDPHSQSGSLKQQAQEEDSRTFDSGVDLDSSQQIRSVTNHQSSTAPVDPMKVLCIGMGSMQVKSTNPQAQRYLTLEKFFQQNEFGDTFLHLTILQSNHPHNINKALALIKAAAPYPGLLDVQNDEGKTPLHFAVICCQQTIVQALLWNGASAGVRDDEGNTPLHLACLWGYREFIKPLCSAHLDMEQWNYDGKRYVHIAAERGDVDALRLLIAHGADCNSRNGTEGHTPLHVAIVYNQQQVVDFLLEECPKLRLETTSYAGLTAYQLAALMNNQTALQRLKSSGAEPRTPPQSDEEEDSEEDEQMSSSYCGSNAFGPNFAGLSAINVA